MKISKELAKGSTGLLVLSVIAVKDMYGYLIAREIGMLSNDVFKLKEGTMYPILHSLEEEGYLEGYFDEPEGRRRRKYYKITQKGRRELERRREEWETYSSAVRSVIGGTGFALA